MKNTMITNDLDIGILVMPFEEPDFKVRELVEYCKKNNIDISKVSEDIINKFKTNEKKSE